MHTENGAAMTARERFASVVDGRRTVAALGALYAVLAVAWAITRLDAGRPLSNVLVVTLFIGVPGIVLLYGGYRLPRTGIRPDLYPTVAGWCLGGLGLMLGSLALYQLEPAESISEPTRAVLTLTAFGSVAGFAVGGHDALAKTHALEVARRNRALEQAEAKLQETVERLEAANDELAESNERLEQFAYAVSHDLQEPLRMVTSYLQLLERRYGDDLDDDAEEFVAFAVDGADRMRTMIDGLLEYSRVETQGDEFEPVDLEAVLADVRQDLRLRIEESDADVEIEPLPRVEGDRDQVRRLFQNLVANALEYSGDDPPRVRVSAERAGAKWRLFVADEGIGIDPDDQERIFEVFQRLHGREEYEGTGIGLALCERIVDRHGGEIRVDSEPGEGSTFSFTLPAVDGRE